MKTAEEILKEHTGHTHGLMDYTQIKAMKAYAKQCAEQTLKDASENALSQVSFIKVDKNSILKTEIKLP